LRARGQVAALLRGLLRGGPQRQRLRARQAPHFVQGAVADAARGGVHRALERRIVGAVGDHAQVGQGVLDFGALEEAHAAVDAVRHLLGDQRFFERARLRVAAVEHRRLAVAAAVAHPLAHALDHVTRLVDLVVGRI
jgi:hypothetical protein